MFRLFTFLALMGLLEVQTQNRSEINSTTLEVEQAHAASNLSKFRPEGMLHYTLSLIYVMSNKLK